MAYAVTLGGFSLLLLMYLLDFSYWGGFIGATLRRLGISVVVACIVASCLLLAKAYPSMPMALFVLGLPLYMWLIRKTVFAHNSIASFFYTASGCTAIASCIALGIWIAWLLSPPGYLYNAETKRIFNRLMHCDEDDARVPICLAAFMLWISPLVNAGICLVLALVTFLLARSTSNAKKSSQIAVKIGGAVLVLCAIGIYLAASIQGANMKATNALYPFMAAGVVVLFVAISSAVGWDSMKQNIFSIPLVKRMREFASFSFARSLITMLAAPFFGVFLVLSVMNQAVRKYLACCGCTKALDDDERKRCLTTVAHHQWTLLMTWKAAEVLYYTLIWQVVGWALIVGSKLTYLIFAMLIKACMVAGLGIGPVTGIFVPTGVVMFLLPPVPGTPVYLAGGILLTRIAEPEFGSFIDGDRCQEIRAPCLDGGAPDANGTCASGETWADRSTGNYTGCDGGFWLGLLYAVCICFILKLFSSALQQKLIGERLGYRVGVRSMIGINSDLVKAIRHILMQPGMKRDKVMCLCGGPDWPTSVTAGILGCKLGRTLYGTLPVVIIVATSAMAGAFLYAKEKGGVYSSLADVVVMIGLMAQLVFMAGAMYYIEDLVQNRPEIIAAMPDDEEVSARRRAARPVTAARPVRAAPTAHFSPPSPFHPPPGGEARRRASGALEVPGRRDGVAARAHVDEDRPRHLVDARHALVLHDLRRVELRLRRLHDRRRPRHRPLPLRAADGRRRVGGGGLVGPAAGDVHAARLDADRLAGRRRAALRLHRDVALLQLAQARGARRVQAEEEVGREPRRRGGARRADHAVLLRHPRRGEDITNINVCTKV